MFTGAHGLPKKGARVVVAMSGGVDSSVAAGWLKENGYDVIGISLQLHDMAESETNEFGTCCSLSDISDARRVAEKIGIPFYVSNMEEEFEEAVVENFVQEYLQGRTPNPCVKCNEKVKFRQLMDWAMDLGADFLATGHYAKSRYNADTQEYELLKGDDEQKDQSYFLFPMKQKDLARTLFPVGIFEKPYVRELAKRYGLSVASKPDSQEICFVQAKSYREFIEEEVPKELLRAGNMIDVQGKVLAQHPGIHAFTIGQRKGLGAYGTEPMYVLELRPETNEVVIGPESYLFRKRATVSHMNWLNQPIEKIQTLTAKIRHRSKESPVEVIPLENNRVEVRFTFPQRAITPGQALVLYDGPRVVGGGWIESLPL